MVATGLVEVFLALLVAVVVAGHGAVGGLVLVVAVRGHQHAGHHGQGAEGGGDHVAHHIAVIVLQAQMKPPLLRMTRATASSIRV